MKTDGYGHGAVPIACMLDDDPDVWAMRLRLWKKQWSFTERESKPTMVLGCVFPDQYEE